MSDEGGKIIWFGGQSDAERAMFEIMRAWAAAPVKYIRPGDLGAYESSPDFYPAGSWHWPGRPPTVAGEVGYDHAIRCRIAIRFEIAS